MRLKVPVTEAMASSSGRAFWRANRSEKGTDDIGRHTQEGKSESMQRLRGQMRTWAKVTHSYPCSRWSR